MDGVSKFKGIRQLISFLAIAALSTMVGCAGGQTGDEEISPANDLDAAAADSSTSSDGDGLEDELNKTETAATEDNTANNFENTDGAQEAKNGGDPAPQATEQAPPPIEEPPPPTPVAEPTPPPPVEDFAAPPPEIAPRSNRIVNITNFKFRANDNGGTFVVEADGAMEYQSRINVDNNQFIVEIPQSTLPAKLRRPFNTKDMPGSIGSIDAYQSPGSTTTRIVVQLRKGAAEPAVQPEGNALLIVAAGKGTGQVVSEGGPSKAPISMQEAATAQAVAEGGQVPEQMEPNAQSTDQVYPELPEQILSASSLEEYLRGNTKFYGKKISIETTEMDVRDVFRLISEETGANLVLADDVKGPVSIRLRQIPWDQALVVIMRAKKLGYTRTGNVLRIAGLRDIREEEDEALTLAEKRKRNTANIRVKLIPISYAKVDEIRAQVESFLSKEITFKDGSVTERPIGKVVADARISALVISDTLEAIARVEKVIKSLDVAPQQVLIEGKIVEASETFQRSIGINWNQNGQSTVLGTNASSGTKIRGQGAINVQPTGFDTGGIMNVSYSLGAMDIFGSINASLALAEREDLVKVLSSPRIMALHNETASIQQSSELPYQTSTVTSGGVVVPSVSFKSVILSLNVTPQITNDGAVIMKTDVKREFPGASDPKTGAAAVNSRSASSKILVMNGQTGVIGGIYQSDATETESRVPWLSQIPILGWLFKSHSREKSKNELLIFLTPRIVNNSNSNTGGSL